MQFLSTLPARGATEVGVRSAAKSFDFYPRSPRGERRGRGVRGRRLAAISIHAPREGSDLAPRHVDQIDL